MQKTGGLVQAANKTDINLGKASHFVDVSSHRIHEPVKGIVTIRSDAVHDVVHRA